MGCLFFRSKNPEEHELHHHFFRRFRRKMRAPMSVEACRTRILKVITKVFEEFTSIRMSTDMEIEGKVLRPIFPTYVPKGHQLKEELQGETDFIVIYENQNGKTLFYTQELLMASENALVICIAQKTN